MYTIKEASARSGVGVPLLRAWERRYGVVSPTRTPSGYRLYDEEAILRLSAMRTLIGQGWAAQQAAERVRGTSGAELHELSRDAAPVEQARSGEPAAHLSSEQLVARIVEAARLLDARAIDDALDDAYGAVRFEAATDHVLMPALRAIGEAWERAEVSVAGEHTASQAVLRRLAMAYEAAGAADGDDPVLVGLGPGARHEFGALAFAIAARRAGLPVLYLGPDLPVESWSSAARERGARAAVLAVPRRSDVERTIEVVEALREAGPSMVLAVGGGHASRVARQVRGTIELPAGMADAVAQLRATLAGSASARG